MKLVVNCLPSSVPDKPNELLNKAPSTVTLLNALLRPPKLKPLADGLTGEIRQ